MRLKDSDLVRRRNNALFAYYGQIMEEHGKYATLIPKQTLYAQVADAFFLSESMVSKIITKMVKETQLKDLELMEDLTARMTINEIHR